MILDIALIAAQRWEEETYERSNNSSSVLISDGIDSIRYCNERPATMV